MSCDIVLVGVGGQGVLTIGDLLLRAAFQADVPASFCPSKGMAQRGGFVKVEIRLGREGVGPRIRDRGADLVVGMERSESLKGIRYAKPEGTFLLYDHVWESTEVMVGTASYPALEQVAAQIRSAAAQLIVLDPSNRPLVQGQPVPANVYVLGAMMGNSPAREVLDPTIVERTIGTRWPKAENRNRAAFRSGLEAVA
jgi:indolepyruvate ferredoxin oxidoreductase beta subunit